MSTTMDDYPDVTDFGVFPAKIELESIRQIESEVSDLRVIGTKSMFVSIGEHPILGSVPILNPDDGTSGYVLADRVSFIAP